MPTINQFGAEFAKMVERITVVICPDNKSLQQISLHNRRDILVDFLDFGFNLSNFIMDFDRLNSEAWWAIIIVLVLMSLPSLLIVYVVILYPQNV
jgi:hypothetical protein